MKGVMDHILSRTKTNISILVFVMIAGIFSYISIAKESKPDVVIPIIHVTVVYDGISSEDSERLLIRPVEQEIKNLEGIKEIQSTAFEGGANILIKFIAGLDTDKTLSDVRDRVARAKPFLPPGTKDPIISEVNLSLFPILTIKLGGKVPKRTLYKIAKDLKADIEGNISSILNVNIVGNQEDLVEIILDPAQLYRLNIPFEQAVQMIQYNNQMISAAYTDTDYGRLNLKISGIVTNIFDIMNLPIMADETSTLMLKDIAKVRKGYKNPEQLVFDRIDYKRSDQAVILEVSKRTGENLIETVEKVRALIEIKRHYLPPHLTVSFSNDESTRIRDMLKELQNNIILAIILVMWVVVATLGRRSALLVGIAVPGAFLMGILALSYFGCTLNIVVLFSLIFSIGMLVDGAIIVVEYADRLIDEDGMEPGPAYIQSAKRMLWPVITSISTILVVFLPLLFWPGTVGQFMKYMPITLLCVLTASILMALIFIPSIVMHLKTPGKRKEKIKNEVESFILDKPYEKVLRFVLNSPKKTILCAVIFLFIVKGMHGIVGKGIEFFPNIEPDKVIFYIHGRGNLSLKEQTEFVKQAESKILDMHDLSSVVTYVGSTDSTDIIGSISVEFIDWKKRDIATKIIKKILDRFEGVRGIYVDFKKQAAGPGNGKPIKLELSSAQSYDAMIPIVKKITDFMKGQKGLFAVENSLPAPSIEWKFDIDRSKAAQMGITVASLGQAIRLLTIGTTVGTYRPDDATDEVDISLRFDKNFRSLEFLETLTVSNQNGIVPVSNFLTYKPQQRVNKIDLINGQKVITIEADISPNFLSLEEQEKINDWIIAQNFPKEIIVQFKGEDEDRKETGAFLVKAFGVALFLVWLILLTQFNSFYKAGLVLSAVVMSTIGVFVGLMIHDMPFGIVMGGIGVIALSGIIVSNNILLIDTFDHLFSDLKKKEKDIQISDIKNIIIETCLQRLRPVILTKLTAILGLLPILLRMEIDFMSFEVHFGGPSTEWWILLAICIVYGILFASSLTLLVTPCALLLKEQYDLKKNKARQSIEP